MFTKSKPENSQPLRPGEGDSKAQGRVKRGSRVAPALGLQLFPDELQRGAIKTEQFRVENRISGFERLLVSPLPATQTPESQQRPRC